MWHASRNSTNKTISHYRSTDALLGTSSDDFLVQSSENLAGPLNATVTSDTDKKCHSSVSIPFEDTDCADRFLDSTAEFPRSNSTTNLLSNLDTVFSIQLNEPYAAKPPSSNVKRFSVPKETGVCKQSDFTRDAQFGQVADKNDNHSTNYGLLHERSVFVHHDETHNVGVDCSSSAADVQKRSQSSSRPPICYRFSAGDADKLEKGIKHIPSTRSLKDNWSANESDHITYSNWRD